MSVKTAGTSGPAAPVGSVCTARPGGQILVAGFGVFAAGLVAAYLVDPTQRGPLWTVLGAWSAAAVLLGVRSYRPAAPTAWLLLAAALLAQTAGELAYSVIGGTMSGREPFPSAADGFYLAVYPFAVAGMVLLTRHDPRARRTGTLIDVLIVATGLAAVVWIVFVVPYARLPQTSWLHKAILIAYLTGDSALLALSVRLPLAGRLRSAPVRLLLAGTVGLLYSDAYHALAELYSWHLGTAADLGWAVFLGCWGAAALCPTMAGVALPPKGSTWATASPFTWMALMCCVALVGPVLLVAGSSTASSQDALVVAVYCVILFALVLTRLVRALADRQRLIGRRESEAYFRTLVAEASDAILIVDGSGRLRYSSPAAVRLFGANLGSGRLADLFEEDDRDRVLRTLAEPSESAALRRRATDHPVGGQPTAEQSAVFRIHGADGRAVYAEARWSDLRDDSTVGGVVLTLRDVTEQRRLNDELRSQALSDPLTGLANRRGMHDRLSSGFSAGPRGSGGSGTGPSGLLMIDLDDFKEVNDTLGHPVGDELIAAVAARISATVRSGDVVARLGGDEFAVLLGDPAGETALEAVAHRLVQAFTVPFDTSAGPLRAAASVGLALTGPDGIEADDLVRNADLALNSAKGEGKHRWRRFDEDLYDEAVERSATRTALDEALAAEALAVWYQPVVRLENDQVAGFEALVRWPHPRRGLLGPGDFVALAEETGQIITLGEQVMRVAVRQAAEWNAEPYQGSCNISVNISVHQLREPGYADTVRQALDEAGLDPTRLILEITESALVEHGDRGDSAVTDNLAALRALGSRIALDDFGTGYASLISLHDLPIDIIKLDKSFTERLADSTRMSDLVLGVFGIAEGLGLSTVAEGLEAYEQREVLVAMGCQFAQGYLYSGPLPAYLASEIRREGVVAFGAAPPTSTTPSAPTAPTVPTTQPSK